MTQKTGLLLLTHSSRETDLSRCSLNFLTRRYHDPNRLNKVPEFEDLDPADSYQGYTGALTFYRVNEYGNSLEVTPVGSVKQNRKIQHAAFLNDEELLVCFENSVESWIIERPLHEVDNFSSDSFQVDQGFTHPHFPGLHTVFPAGEGRAILSSSSSDKVFLLDVNGGTVTQSSRLDGDHYGTNYELTPDMDLRKHYIPNDYQITHLNSAYPLSNEKLVVSTLIQGAIGTLDIGSGSYTEVISGFVGAHGARATSNGDIYFADSVTGTLVLMKPGGEIKRRFSVASNWLHDVQQIYGNIYAFALADKNELRIYDIDENSLLFRRTFRQSGPWDFWSHTPFWLGDSTQFLSFYPFNNRVPSGAKCT